jgi:glutathione transport system substrate-binding protein
MKRLLSRLAIAGVALGMGMSSAFAEGTLYFGLSGEPTTLDPIMVTGTTWRTVNLAINRGLVNYGASGEISNEIAESYEISPDAMEFTFHLRDAKFHDGTTVTANDVKASLERVIAPDSVSMIRSQLTVISSIEVVDDKTVKLKLSKPSVSLLGFLALPEAAIVPASWIEAFKADPELTPVGAGPFKFVHWERGQEILLEKFADYYKPGLPYLDSIHYNFLSDENTRVNAIKSGDVDIIDYVPARELEALDADPDIELQRTTGPSMVLMFNTKFEPFSNPLVRQAVSLAMDRDAVINSAFNGVGSPLYGIGIPEGYVGYSADKANLFEQDIDKAKALMAEAGYPDGFDARLLSSSQYSFYQNTAIVAQSDLAKIGIRVTLDMPDWSGRTVKQNAADYDFSVSAIAGLSNDPDWLTYFYYGGDNLVRGDNPPYFDDAKINELLDKGRATPDAAEREKIYSEFVDLANELSPYAFLMWRDQSYAVRANVTGFQELPGFLNTFSGYTVETAKVE